MSKQTFKATMALFGVLMIILVAIPGVFRPVPVFAQEPHDITMVPGTVDVEEEVENAVRQALASGRSTLPAADYYAISGLREADNWFFISVVGLKDLKADLGWNLLDNGVWFGLVLLRQHEDGRYTGAVEGTTEFTHLLADVPENILSDKAKQDLDPLQRRLVITSTSYRFPWESGTMMSYGQNGVHDNGFSAIVSGWKAVDFLSDGNTDAGHAPNRLLAAAAGTIGYVCQPGPGENSTAIRIGDLFYTHLLIDGSLYTGRSVNQGEELGQMKGGSFNETCGYAYQGSDWFHVHWGFPNTGSFQVEDWTLNLSDGLWRRGGEVRGVGNWFLAAGGSGGPKVKLYSEANWGGSTVFSGGTGFSNDPNANSYSMEIPSGWSVKTWRGDDRTGGEPRCWWESVPNLQDHGWHLAIQSIEVYDYNACPQVELFSHANYDNRIFNGGPGFHDNLGANSYSMRMPSGWSVKTWRGDDRTGGEPRCWWESIPNLQDHGWHLAIRSMEIHDHYVCDPIRLNFATGLGHQADVEIVVTRVGNDQDRLFQNIVTTDSQGNYSGELLLPEHIKPGKYDIYAKPSAYLRRNVSNFQLNPGTNTVNFSSPFLAGDIDKNGQDNRINVMDLLRVLQEWGSSQSIADLNRDGIVGIGDMLLILQNWGPGDGWHDDGPFIGASGATAIGAQDAIVAQDATGTVTLAPDAGTFNVGDTFGVQVLLDTGGHDADGVDLVILYDPGVLEVQDADPTEPGVQVSAGSIYSNIQENMADPSLGEIRFSADGATFQGSGTLATITFTVVASINNTAVKVYYGNGWTAETNIVESESIVDVLAQANAASFQTIGSPSRSMPTVSFTPSTDAVLNSSLIELEVEATDPYTQVKEVKFEVDLSGEWTTIGADTYSPNGWGLVWDASSVSDGSYEMRATAFLLGGEGTTVTNTNIMLDRVPPMYALSAFTPSSAPSTGVPVTIEVIAADEGSGVDYIDVYANSANDGSTNGVWNFLGSISGSQGSLIWDTSGYSIGVHQIAFDIRDMAGNQGPDPQPQLFFTIEGGNKTYLPIILKQ